MSDKKISSEGLEVCVITAAVVLMCIGLLAIYAASAMKGIHQMDDPYLFLRKQSMVALFGIVCFGFARLIKPTWLSSIPLPLFLFTLALLALILVPGAYAKVNGATRWLDLPFQRYQTSELAKIALILFLAKNLSRKSSRIESFWGGILPNVAFFGTYALFLMLQPDFGTTALLACITFCMLVVAGIAVKYTLAAMGAAIILFGSAIYMAPYRMKRMLAFIDPWDQIREGGFQIIQSYLAFQNGGFSGTGLGESKQKLFFLPEAHTDFILSVIGEELGLIGVSFVVACYGVLSFCCFQITKKQKEPFLRYCCFGLTLLISVQAIFNMGVVTGMLPTKGIPLPFISNGASSLFTFILAICILLMANNSTGSESETKLEA